MSLIYLISSLPFLTFDATPALTLEQFEGMCADQLDGRDAQAVRALLGHGASDHPFVSALRDKETILRNSVARRRAARRAEAADSQRWLRPTQGCDSQIENRVDDAFEESDPLSRERELDKIRWIIAEELQGPDPLDKRAVFAYAVKLAILARWQSLETDRGRSVFDGLTETPINLNPES